MVRLCLTEWWRNEIPKSRKAFNRYFNLKKNRNTHKYDNIYFIMTHTVSHLYSPLSILQSMSRILVELKQASASSCVFVQAPWYRVRSLSQARPQNNSNKLPSLVWTATINHVLCIKTPNVKHLGMANWSNPVQTRLCRWLEEIKSRVIFSCKVQTRLRTSKRVYSNIFDVYCFSKKRNAKNVSNIRYAHYIKHLFEMKVWNTLFLDTQKREESKETKKIFTYTGL